MDGKKVDEDGKDVPTVKNGNITVMIVMEKEKLGCKHCDGRGEYDCENCDGTGRGGMWWKHN